MARVNYQREKRLKDLDRQRKQEEKRKKKLERANAPGESEASEIETTPEDAEPGDAPELP